MNSNTKNGPADVLDKLLNVFYYEDPKNQSPFGYPKTPLDFTPLYRPKRGVSFRHTAKRGTAFALSFKDTFGQRMVQYLKRYPAATEIDFVREDIKQTTKAMAVINPESAREKNIYLVFTNHKDFLKRELVLLKRERDNAGLLGRPFPFKTSRVEVAGLFTLLFDAGVLDFKSEYAMAKFIEQSCLYSGNKKMSAIASAISQYRNHGKSTGSMETFWKDIFNKTEINKKD
ncbi:MAG: hypothetical protein ACXVNM_01195 [Bacteroidia bacterium]